jgi:hypothetical protein
LLRVCFPTIIAKLFEKEMSRYYEGELVNLRKNPCEGGSMNYEGESANEYIYFLINKVDKERTAK